MADHEYLGFWANVRDGQNNETLQIAVETDTGKPVALVIKDRETLETLARVHVPVNAASSIGQALMLASTMKASEVQA